MADQTDVLRVGNCSGFYGDRLSAFREMLTGGPIDVVTGDYLAELTMLILGKDQLKDPSAGYAKTFLRQCQDALGEALERGVRVVVNAGGLNPAGLVEKLREVSAGLGLDPSIAYVEGDDVRDLADDLGFDQALTAHAYLGAFGIARALGAGADIVVTGRVTDASLVVGPAIDRFGWTPDDLDALAGAVVAGHVIECGTQATGGNFSGFASLTAEQRALPLGFPIAEIAADGSSVITKHPGTGGAVTVDTVTAQLMYEIQEAHYLGPDVTADLTSIRLTQEGPDRVAIGGVRGEEPPATLKVGVNELGGFANTAEFVLTGLDLEAKEAWLRDQFAPAGETVVWTRGPDPAPDADTQEGAALRLRCTVQDPSAEVAGRAFTAPAVEIALASYPGFTMTAPPGPARPFGVFRAEYVDRDRVTQTVVLPDGSREEIIDPWIGRGVEPGGYGTGAVTVFSSSRAPAAPRRVPLGTFVHARSGDKGGHANVGLWVSHDGDPRFQARVAWLLEFAMPEAIAALLPEAADLQIDRTKLANLGGVNLVFHGLLGRGVAASTRFDPQAKALGEFFRSRLVDIPEDLL